MKKRSGRRLSQFPRLHLEVEQLESRELLDAALGEMYFKVSSSDAFQVNAVPNDTSFGTQWALNNTGQSGGIADADIDAPEAWDITTGSAKTVVAVIDTGIDYKHKDLYRNIWLNQGEIPKAIKNTLIDTDGDARIGFWDLNDERNQGSGKITDLNANGFIDAGDVLKPTAQGGWANGVSEDGGSFIDDLVGWDFANNDNNPFDDNGHGTHVSGIIGATGQDGLGVAGINWKVSMMAIKSIGATGTGASPALLAGLNYAVDHGAVISNNSYGGTDFNQAMYNAIDTARSRGHIFVVSAGNGGSDLVGDNLDYTPEYPAAYNLRNVVAVAATARSDARYAPSNYGAKTVDLGAPGRDILSTVPNNRYAGWSGTSMAAPHVTGVLALVHGQHTDWQYYQTIDQVLNNVDKIPSMKGRTVTEGRLNAFKAVSHAQVDRSGPVVVSMVASATGSKPVSSVRVTFSEAIKASTLTASDVVLMGPNGAISVTRIDKVANADDRVFDLVFATQTAPGNYRVDIGPDVRDLAGNAMDHDRDGVLNEAVQDSFAGAFVIQPTYTYSHTTATTIRDLAITTSPIVIDRDITIADLNVRIDIKHSFNNDLYIHLKGPDGTDVILVNRRGGSSDNFANTLLDDEATGAVGTATAPFAGTYRPELSLSVFDGKNAQGTWQLIVEDKQRGDVGTIKSWSLIIENGGAIGTASVADAGFEKGAELSSLAGVAAAAGMDLSQDWSQTIPFLRTSQPVSDQIPQRRRFVGSEQQGALPLMKGGRAEIDRVFTVLRSDMLAWTTLGDHETAPSEDELTQFFALDS